MNQMRRELEDWVVQFESKLFLYIDSLFTPFLIQFGRPSGRDAI